MDINENYLSNIKNYSNNVSRIKKNLRIISLFRFLSFVLSFVLLFSLKNIGIYFSIFGFILLLSLFIILIIRYLKLKDELLTYENLVTINQNEIKALNFDFSVFDNGNTYSNPKHHFTFDLDIFGKYSIFQFVNRTCTAIGNALLANWLNAPLLDKNAIVKRQQSVKELKDKLKWRQFYHAIGNKFDESEKDEYYIFEWLNELPQFSNKIGYKILRYLFPLITLSSLVLGILKHVPMNFFYLLFITQLVFSYFELKKMNNANDKISKRLDILKKYSRLIQQIEEENFETEYLCDLKNQLWLDGTSASQSLLKLSKLLNALEGKNNMIAGPIINGLFSWNIHFLIAIEKWKIKYKNHIQKWFDTIKNFDVYNSLGNYAYNNPNYIFPNPVDSTIMDSKELGHPLIPTQDRVCNDFKLLNPGEFIIITGPNMAGKTTFLRTIGVNLLLAQIGAPVCAKSMIFKPTNMYTSMRTTDSLSENESYFLAELNRFKNLFDIIDKDDNYLIMLDEILKGTNIQDKQNGSKIILEKLILKKIPGIIATHDLTISDLKNKFPENIIDKSFEIGIRDDEIIYNYKLKDGISRKMNAMILMKQMGID